MKTAKTARAAKAPRTAKAANRTDWFTDARFGMFIHWGLYSMPARHEWVMNTERIAPEAYRKYFERFDPDLFAPREWARAAKAAGMRYVVVTTKHHEGFCLWDSKFTDYKATNTPAKRDLLREIVDAFRAEGIRIGFYYSLLDWHHPDFPIDSHHPLRDLPMEEIKALNAKRDIRRYRKYMLDQVRELLTGYGKIDILWFDFSYPEYSYRGLPGKGRNDWDSESIVRLARRLQPGIILDNRLDLPGAGDIETPEQFQPDEPPRRADGSIAPWEGCQTLSGSWGYHRDEATWKSDRQCIELLVRHVARGGNLIMNVGPTSRGYLDGRALAKLDAYARWMSLCERSIRGCTMAPAEFPEPNGARYTWNPATGRLYVHVLDWPFQHLHLPNLSGKVAYAQLLHDGSEVRFDERASEGCGHGATPKGAVTLSLPVVKPDVEVPVVELFIKR